MAKFAVAVYDRDGGLILDVIEAESEFEAASLVCRECRFFDDCVEEDETGEDGPDANPRPKTIGNLIEFLESGFDASIEIKEIE